jgi:hypothetical protein
MLLTLLALLAGLLFLELALSTFMAPAWRYARWAFLPVYGIAIADIIPLGLMTYPWFLDTVTSYLLALALAFLVATGGHFRDTFWRGMTPEELARTGRRSVYERAPRAIPAGRVRVRRA